MVFLSCQVSISYLFSGGIKSVFPGTARVEADFSIIGWEKDEYRQQLCDLALEGILHSEQLTDLNTLDKILI